MRKYKALLYFIVFAIFLSACYFVFNTKIYSNNTTSLPSITVINLIRGKELGHEKDNLYSSLLDQWEITSKQKINATWLLQYSVLEDKSMTDFMKTKMKNQEFGLLFEIDRNFASKANVLYRGQGPTYFSDGLLLASYDLSERRKLIDTAFSKFYKVFGYFPKTVGAWYIGSDSLNYMQQKYGIVASLKASDQYNLDVYTVWGSPFDISYLSSKNNQLIPADSYDQSSKVVNLQWAARDLNKGYLDPLFSVQDFQIKSLDSAYVNYFADTFLKSKYDNLVFGLENGGDKKVFEKYYQTMLIKAKELESTQKVKISLAKDFADEFLNSKSSIPTTNYFLTKDYQSNNQAFWYSTSSYRVYLQKDNENINLIDVRDYSNKINEDYNYLNNSQGMLTVSSPKILDSRILANTKKLIAKSSEELKLKKINNEIILTSGNIKIGTFLENKFSLFENGKSVLFDFTKKDLNIDIFFLMLILYIFYFVLVQFFSKKILILFSIFIPLFFSYPFLSSGLLNNLSFIFDKKELILLNLVANKIMLTNIYLIVLFEVLPLLALLIFNFLYLWKQTNIFKYSYLLVFILVSTIYAHLFYFPLDKQTLIYFAIVFCLFNLLIIVSIFLKYGLKNKKQFIIKGLVLVLLFSIFLGTITFISRSKTILTNFEMQSLNIIKNKGKDVIFVTQSNYNVKPIYKAVKPFLLENIDIAQKLTNTNWTTVLRPENNVLKITNYNDKLILIPRYLGSDLSPYEEKQLGLIKIFDNYQIAIYEKK